MPSAATGRIGVTAMGGDAKAVTARIVDMERQGIPSAWLTTGGAGLDGLTLLSAAAAQTQRIQLGTCIVPTWPRHPITMVQQVQVIEQLAPRRLLLGIGPSHKPSMQGMYGFDFNKPLTNLREYVHVVKVLLRDGSVDFDGFHYHAHARIAAPIKSMPILASALQPKSYEFCGAETDGAISWVCPAEYLVNTALPAMQRGAAAKGRAAPPLYAHVPVAVHDDPKEARQAAKQQLAGYPRLPFYAQMFAQAGFPEPLETKEWTDALVDATVVYGNETTVATKLEAMFAQGIGQIIANILPMGAKPDASRERTLNLIASLARNG